MPVKHILYTIIKPQDLRFQALDGNILLILANYSEVFENPPPVLDGVSQVFRVEVDHDEVQQRQEGAVMKLLLWRGDQNARVRPQDYLTLKCESLSPLVASDPEAQEVLAGKALSRLSDQGKLAVVIAMASPEALALLPGVIPSGVADLKIWAQNIMAEGS
jgi:hypothetical protein